MQFVSDILVMTTIHCGDFFNYLEKIAPESAARLKTRLSKIWPDLQVYNDVTKGFCGKILKFSDWKQLLSETRQALTEQHIDLWVSEENLTVRAQVVQKLLLLQFLGKSR